MGESQGGHCGDFRENRPRYNGTAQKNTNEINIKADLQRWFSGGQQKLQT